MPRHHLPALDVTVMSGFSLVRGFNSVNVYCHPAYINADFRTATPQPRATTHDLLPSQCSYRLMAETDRLVHFVDSVSVIHSVDFGSGASRECQLT
ncbi:hypothetical protein E2C01_018863 [Portunus trituberculatus]|uniref:Uncharacterized protein n=1 Tax=Portunus trituberculatus TaxID=210409 RepID=A0A5B7DVT1_PORTR|nr:hypothetical protein [Portunus trituberculatus]